MTGVQSLGGTVTGSTPFVLPEPPRLAQRPDATADWQASILLSRRPGIADGSVDTLVIGGAIRLRGTLGAVSPDATGRAMVPAFLRGKVLLRDADSVIAETTVTGVDPVWTLSATLSATQAQAVARAVRGVASSLSVASALERPASAQGPAAELSSLIRSAHGDGGLRFVVLQPDGTVWTMPPVRRDIPVGAMGRMAGAGEEPPMLVQNHRLVALPLAASSGAVAHPTAAAMIAGAGPAIATGPTSHVYVAGDAIGAFDGSEPDDDMATPTEHLPMVTDAAAPYWLDAMDDKQGWYAPALAVVAPAPSDDPAHATFCFTIERTGVVVGPAGAGTGLRGVLRLTAGAAQTPNTTAALTAAKVGSAQAVALQNVSAAFELPYRQAGASTVLLQRFQGIVSVAGNRITVEVALLDDWVRLAYAALAYPPASGMSPPRLIVDYAFRAYGRTRAAVLGGGVHHSLPGHVSNGPLPHPVVSPMLLKDRLAVMGPTSILQFGQESPGVGRDFQAIRLTSNTLTAVRPDLVATMNYRTRLITRSIVREESLTLSMPCSTFGGFYLEQSGSGATTAIGCQDSLRLGETNLRSFEEVVKLRSSRARVFQSLQQPGRYLLLPAAYRVGRYAAASGARAFKPMIMIYAVLNSDPTKNRYALTATLVPDLSPADNARLTRQLAAMAPKDSAPTIVLPTDPFVGAQVALTWVVPADWPAPTSAAILDELVVTTSLPMDQALLMINMMDNGGMLGSVRFTLPDGLMMDAALTIDGTIVGPADSGPITTSLAGGTATLANPTQQAMHVTDLLTVTADGALATVPVDELLAPSGTTTVAAGAGATGCFADAAQAQIIPIAELDIFEDDVSTDVTFINQVNFANHRLTALSVKARIKGDTHEQTVALPEAGTASLSFTQKITTYLGARSLEYALIQTSLSGTTIGAWRPWDLNRSIVIGVTADQIQG